MAGCATKTVVKTDFCSPWSAIYASKEDVLTDGTAKQIQTHDEVGAKLCGWKPKTPTASVSKSLQPSSATSAK